MNTLITIFLFLVILSFLVFVHELGHFLAAKISKIPVKEFAIGFGPILFSKKVRETHYRIRALPLGGFVSLEGEHETATENGFRNRPFHTKFFVLIGGIFMNIVTAIIFLAIFLGMNGNTFVIPNITDFAFSNTEKQAEYYPIQIINVDESLGWQNISEDDLIIEVNNIQIESIEQFNDILAENRGEELTVKLIDLVTLEESEKTITVGGLTSNKYAGVIIKDVLEESPAKDILEAGDIIIGANSEYFTNRSDFLGVLNDNQEKTVEFIVLGLESSEEKIVSVDLQKKSENGSILYAQFDYYEGIDYAEFSVLGNSTYFIKYNSNFFAPFSFTYDVAIYQVKGLAEMISTSFRTGDLEEVKNSVGSPIAVGDTVGDVVEYRVFESLVPLTAFISLSLAIFNVLPIPALDGGQIMVAFIEMLRRKKLSDDTVNKINFAGFAFIMSLSVLIILKDIDQYNVVSGFIDSIKKVFGK